MRPLAAKVSHLARAFQLLLLAGLFLAPPSRAMDYSVPFVLDGLSQSGPNALLGLGATVGQIEVRGETDGNGIDGFAGHCHSAFAPGTAFVNTGDTLVLVNYGYQDVKDFSGNDAATGDPSDSDFHGTFVAGFMANNASVTVGGTNYPFSGVAPGAAYYGAVFSGASTKAGFVSLQQSLDYLVTSANTQVINNSWGSSAASAAELDGNDATSLLMDEYTGYFGKTGGYTGAYKDRLMVYAAGNDGDTTGLLGSPASSFNGLSVGALGAIDNDAAEITDPDRAPSTAVASFSSWKPLADGRSGVHVVAPGTNLWSNVSINVAQELWGITSDSTLAGAASGTSFAAPHVTGEAALLYGAGTFPLFSGLTEKGTLLSTDHKLIKAIIINSAEKIAGLDAEGNAQTTWQPGWVTTNSEGVTTALAPLNYAVGAGMADANAAYGQYREAPGSFWEIGAFTLEGERHDYTFGSGKFLSLANDEPFLFSLTATLVWDRHVDFNVDTSLLSEDLGTLDKALLSNLDLVLQQEITPGLWKDLYISSGAIGNVGHIYMPQLDGNGNYRLEVRANNLADPGLGEQYALAVSYTTVPEPGSLTLIVFVIVLRLARRRRG